MKDKQHSKNPGTEHAGVGIQDPVYPVSPRAMDEAADDRGQAIQGTFPENVTSDAIH